jgi:tight adherence protein B
VIYPNAQVSSKSRSSFWQSWSTGNPAATLLEKLAHIVRERFRLRGEIKSLTAEGRMQALVLIALPFVVWLALCVLNPVYAFKLFAHPWVIATMLIMMFVGTVWINRIVNFDF